MTTAITRRVTVLRGTAAEGYVRSTASTRLSPHPQPYVTCSAVRAGIGSGSIRTSRIFDPHRGHCGPLMSDAFGWG